MAIGRLELRHGAQSGCDTPPIRIAEQALGPTGLSDALISNLDPVCLPLPLSQFLSTCPSSWLFDSPSVSTMSNSVLPQWPPEITDEQRENLTLLATTYALSHGLIYLPPADVQPPAPTSAIHAPLALFPSPFPRKQFLLAKELQSTYNALYARIAMDEEFLDRVMGAEHGVGRVDEFTGELWKIWKRLRVQGITQVRFSFSA